MSDQDAKAFAGRDTARLVRHKSLKDFLCDSKWRRKK